MAYADEIVLSFFEEIEEDFEWVIERHDGIAFVIKEMQNARQKIDEEIPFDQQKYTDLDGKKYDCWRLLWKGKSNRIGDCGQGGYRIAAHEAPGNLQKLCQLTEKLLQLPPDRPDLDKINSIFEADFSVLYPNNKLYAMFSRALIPIFPGKFTMVFDKPDELLNFLMSFPEAQNAPWNKWGNFLENRLAITDAIKDIFGKSLKDQIAEWNKTSGQKPFDYNALISPFAWYLKETMVENNTTFELHKQVIYTGSPGTGKTYLAKQKAKRRVNLFLEHSKMLNAQNLPSTDFFFECIQFHPSYGYEDFIEGIRPTGIQHQSAGIDFDLQDGSLKSFCRKAGLLEIVLAESGIPLTVSDSTGKISDTLGDVENKVTQKDKGGWKSLFAPYKKRRGALLERNSIKFWEDYTDFLSGLSQDEKKKSFGSWLPPFFLIIDEVNRAELSRVFGELMYCFEYRGSDRGSIRTQYAALMDKKTECALAWHPERGSIFFLPHNLYIIGTMNNIDRSVETFDLALRRRFYWEEKSYRSNQLKRILERENGKLPDGGLPADDIKKLLGKADSLNKEIEQNEQLGKDYQIGQAYFLKIFKYTSETSSQRRFYALWDHHLFPLLKEYVRGIPGADDILKTLKSAYEK